MAKLKGRNGQGTAKAVEVLGEVRARRAASLLGCRLDTLQCTCGGKDRRWIRVSVPEGLAAFFDQSGVSIRAGTPDGIITKLRKHPARITTVPATG